MYRSFSSEGGDESKAKGECDFTVWLALIITLNGNSTIDEVKSFFTSTFK